MKYIIAILMILLLFSCRTKNKSMIIISPSGGIKATVIVNGKKIFYSVTAVSKGVETVVIPSSPLGLKRSDASFYDNLSLDSITTVRVISDSYTMITGKQKQLSYKATEATICLSNNSKQKLHIEFRVFNEGVAFRYVFPDKSDSKVSVLSEETGFLITDSANAWMSAYRNANLYGEPGYEEEYLALKSGTPSPSLAGWSFPLLFEKDSYWLFISESGLGRNYCGSHLRKDCTGGLYTIAFPQPAERYNTGEANPSSELPWIMPWRYIIVGKTINEVVESSMVYHLAEPCKLDDISWIKPGRSSWEWWSSTSGRNVKNLKEFIDLSSEMSWEYSLIDGGWPKMPEGSVDELVSYAKSKKVDITIWYNSGGRRDTTQKDEDFVMFNDDTRLKEFEHIATIGIKGVKIDFFAGDKQYVIQLYQNILRDAAKYHLLVDFHGCTLPRGWTRTYPNLLAMEAVKGAECYRYSEKYSDMAARYNTIAALVRGTAGPTDYTPATFTNQKYPHKTTSAHELALTVVYESGIIHMADKPEGYSKLPKEAKEFLKRVPAAWDETRLLAAVPGELFVIARKRDGKWYVAGINGKNEAQEIKIDFPETLVNPIILADGKTLADISIMKIKGEVSNYTLNLMPQGGFVMF
jgi:alpha-glucosidase